MVSCIGQACNQCFIRTRLSLKLLLFDPSAVVQAQRYGYGCSACVKVQWPVCKPIVLDVWLPPFTPKLLRVAMSMTQFRNDASVWEVDAFCVSSCCHKCCTALVSGWALPTSHAAT